jgi:hypothetical protein
LNFAIKRKVSFRKSESDRATINELKTEQKKVLMREKRDDSNAALNKHEPSVFNEKMSTQLRRTGREITREQRILSFRESTSEI